MTDLRQVTAAVDSISSVDDAAQLAALQRAVDQFFASSAPAQHLDVWFRLFERFPEDDGYEMFWSVLHGLEAQPGYEPLVVESVRRRPSQFPVLMLNRMLNAGQTAVGDVDLLALLESVAADESCPASVRDDARRFVQYQTGRA